MTMKFGINLYLWADDMHDGLMPVLDCCAAVGSGLLCGPHQVALGVFTGRGATDSEWQRCVAHLRRAAEYAAGAGVVLAEEVVNRFELYHLNTLDQAIRCVDEVDHPNCRIHLDTFHAHIEEKDPAAAIRRAASRIAHVHISENDRGVPGTGSVAWGPTFAALHDIGYDGWLTVEAFGNFLPNLAAATKIWRKLFESEDELAADAYAFVVDNWQRTAAVGAAS